MDGKVVLLRAVTSIAVVLGMLVAPPAGAAGLEEVAMDVEVLKQDVEDVAHDLKERAGLSGYYDFEYHNDDKEGSPGEFRQHHVSLFVSRTWRDWRFFTELEWEDAPTIEGGGGTGEILVESAWVEYLHADWLNVRGGKFLLPQHWNVNHYPNVVLSTQRPLMVKRIYPGDSTGVMVYGTAFAGDMGATYRLYVANGETVGKNQHKEDDNNGKAVGGRFTFHLGDLMDVFTRFDVGVSGYTENAPAHGGTRDIYGFDAQINTSRAELLMEYANGSSDGVTDEGLYVQPSVRVVGELRVFYRYGYKEVGKAPKETRHTLGVNYRPMPNVSLKAEVNTNEKDDDTTEDWNGLSTSVAIFF